MANILIAEDDRSMLNFLKMALERAGHTVTTSENGKQALNILSDQKGFDLLLTDIVMPEIDGIELSQKAGEIDPAMKVVFITGFAAVSLGHNKAPDRSAKILSKPFHLNELVGQVETLLAA